jgi:glyoxylase-like metal-dependent hydrolase (beta-lactamase superfamily II)
MWSHVNGLRFERIVVPTPYKVGPANVYVFPDDPITLFDCGPNTLPTENALILGLAQHGLHLEQIARVVISHGHPDHYGLAPRIRVASGAKICVGEHDAAKLGGDSMLMATGKLLLEQGMPMEELVDMGERERGLGDLRPTIDDLRLLRGGERLEFGGSEMEVLHLPGHTAGHICLFHRPSGSLFAGDTLLLHISPNPLLEPDPADPTERRRSLLEYIQTLDVLASLPLSKVFPGHGPVIDDPRALIDEMRRHHRERADDLAGMLTDDGRSAWQLANQLFANLEGFDNFLAVSEVVAHIDLLVEQGRAEPVEREGVTYYRLPRESGPGAPVAGSVREP